jgi:hypothetical protein
MLKIIEQKQQQQIRRFQVAREYALKLRSLFGKVAVVVYGSTARGDFNEWSDIDLVVICEELPVKPLERLDLLYEYSEGMIEPKGYTLKEFEMIKETPFGKLLQAEGVVIVDDFRIFE